MAKLSFEPLTAERWEDFEQLFGKRGACGGCWCMHWRIRRSQYELQKGELNRLAMKSIVERGEVPGILAYTDEQPVGWCAVAPRDTYITFERSRILKPIDNQPVWSIVCLFVAKPFRRHGISFKLLKAAVEYVRRQGGSIVEGYPVAPQKETMPDVFAFTGLASAYIKAGFRESARRSVTRPIMRYHLTAGTRESNRDFITRPPQKSAKASAP
jgi:GNAT superfamily N-acetyltransferase